MATKIEWIAIARPGTITWKDIPGFPGYMVSRWGEILSWKSNRILKPIVSSDGYHYVFLYDGSGNSQRMRIHRAVLFAFVGPPSEGQECRHLDGNPANNWFENLAWGTRLENARDRKRHGRMPIPHKSSFTKLKPADIPEIKTLRQQGLSSRKVAKIYGTSHTTILKIWRGERWKGY